MAKIAWIEDDHRHIRSLVKLLERDGHTILPFASWQEISDHISVICACDAIILDIILPPIENDPYVGLSVLELLRKQQGYEGPIIVCSRARNPVVLNALLEFNVTQVLRKPVRPSVLYDVVRMALESE